MRSGHRQPAGTPVLDSQRGARSGLVLAAHRSRPVLPGLRGTTRQRSSSRRRVQGCAPLSIRTSATSNRGRCPHFVDSVFGRPVRCAQHLAQPLPIDSSTEEDLEAVRSLGGRRARSRSECRALPPRRRPGIACAPVCRRRRTPMPPLASTHAEPVSPRRRPCRPESS